MTEKNEANREPELDIEGLRIGFDMAHDLVQVQLGQNDALDTKANFVLGSATVLVGTYAAFLAAHLTTRTYAPLDYLLLNGPLGLSYLATLIFAYLGYIVREFKTVPNPQKFVELLLHLDERKMRLTLLKAMAAAYEVNSSQLARKANYVMVALTFLFIEAIVLVATLGFIAIV